MASVSIWFRSAAARTALGAIAFGWIVNGAAAGPEDRPAMPAPSPISEVSPFDVPTGAPEPPVEAAADEVRALETGLLVTFREKEPGALSVSRFIDNRLHCEMRVAPGLEGALDTLAPMLYGRLSPEIQARFALAHELGHCRMRAAFMLRPDGRVDDPSVFPWVAQEVAADVYGMLLVERGGGAPPDLRRWIVAARRVMAERQNDRSHATANFLAPAMSIPRCRAPRTDPELLDCAIGAAYMTVGYLAFVSEHAVGERVPRPSELVEIGTARIRAAMRTFDSPADYQRRFVGADLAQFEFRDVAQIGSSHYLTAVVSGADPISAARRLADFCGSSGRGSRTPPRLPRRSRRADRRWAAERRTTRSSASRVPSPPSARAG
jgi:hypothetical protein